MNLRLVGLNHRTAPVEVRERYAVAADRMRVLNEKLAGEPGCEEAVLVSTCNRTELIVVTRQEPEMREWLLRFLAEEVGDGSASSEHLYEHADAEAVRHLFRVGASLDSMVLGEAQILGQLKDAYRAAIAARSCGPLLHRLFERAFRTAKRVRTETGLGASPVSVARVGVQLAAEVFERFDEKRVLLIGAGDMAESALLGLQDAGARDVVVLNRTPETAARLAARFSARPGALDELERELREADIALSSVQVERPLLGRAELERCMLDRAGNPLLLIDLGLPRNLHPDANDVDDVYLYDLDDLDEIAERGRARRREAADPAEAIVAREVERYLAWKAGLDAVPVMRELQERVLELTRLEVRRSGQGLDDPEVRRALEQLAEGLAKKLLHAPLERLRREAREERAPYYADAVREIFGLVEDEE